MKSIATIVLFPVLSVIILSLYVQGGTARIVALVLLAASAAGAVVGIFLKGAHASKRSPRSD